jgi:hypothetical protein
MCGETGWAPLRFLRGFSVPKREDAPNEDRWAHSHDGTICAVSDGASVSYDPGPWAEILTRRFVIDQNLSRAWISAAAKLYREAYDRDAMQWTQQGAFDRGSFATLLGVVCSSDGCSARAFAMGDSLLVLTDGDRIVRTLPYDIASQFDLSPLLFSTNPLENSLLDEHVISGAWHNLDVSSCLAPTFLLTTDSIGRWLLEQPDADRVSRLLGIEHQQAFAQFVERECLEGRLRRDDATLVVVGVPA